MELLREHNSIVDLVLCDRYLLSVHRGHHQSRASQQSLCRGLVHVLAACASEGRMMADDQQPHPLSVPGIAYFNVFQLNAGAAAGSSGHSFGSRVGARIGW